MSATYASLRLITATAICLLILHRSKVAAQSPTLAMANACYVACEASWSAFIRNASSPRAFIAKYENSTQKAADYFCSSIANISACFNACAESYFMFAYQDKFGTLSSLANQNYSCFTDDAMCRAKDSQLFCNAYYTISCGDNATRRDECISGVQAQRGCNLTSSTHQSQRVVMAMRLDDALYCLNDIDLITLDPLIGDQVLTCLQYMPPVCLSAFINERTGLYDPYYTGNVTCRDVQTARYCVQASLTQTIDFYGQEYSMPCRYHPDAAAVFAKLDAVLSTLLPCSSQAGVNNSAGVAITTVAMPSKSTTRTITTVNDSSFTTRIFSKATVTNVLRSTTSTYTRPSQLKNSFWFITWSSASTYSCNTLMMMHFVAVTICLYFCNNKDCE